MSYLTYRKAVILKLWRNHGAFLYWSSF